MKHVWNWKKKAEAFFGKGNVKVFLKNEKQMACVRISTALPWDYWCLENFNRQKK